MKMKEKGDIGDKKASKKQFTTFVSSFLVLSFHTLILSYTLAHLEHSWSTLVFTWIWRKISKKEK